MDNDADKENILVGDYVTWILNVQNFGPDEAKNVKVHDTLPEGLQYISHTTTKGIFDHDSGIWDIGDLKIEDGLVKLFIKVKALTAGEKVNEAYITSDTNNTNTESYEQEEIDDSRDGSEASEFEKNVAAESSTEMHETGNPILLILMSLLMLPVAIFKR